MFSVLSSSVLSLRLSEKKNKQTKLNIFNLYSNCHRLTGYVHKGYSRKVIWPGVVVPACNLRRLRQKDYFKFEEPGLYSKFQAN